MIPPVNRRALLAGAGAAALLPAALLPSGFARAQTRRTPVRVGVIPIVGAAPLFVAEGEGWLKQAGLDLTVTTFESGPNMIQALASGTVDVYVAGVAPLGVARARGVDVKVVAATATGENVLVVSPRLAAHFAAGVAPAEAFRKYRAAAGKPAKLSTQPAGSVPNTTLQYWLWEVAKVAREDVEIAPMGIDATQQAILSDAVEGGTVREPALTIIQKRNPRVKLVASGDEMFPGQPGTVVAVSGAFAGKEGAAVQSLVSGLVKAVDLLGKDVPKVAPHVAASLGKGLVDAALIADALRSPASKFVADPRVIVGPSKAMQAYQVKLGSLKEEAPLDALFDASFFLKAVGG
ncbi:MAG: ABC transporter substrate-binding protein [Rhizobiales bacterium]|nr:ABC transporter substrate-binding protein [Hyphomicrobiales bacterium]